MNLKFLLRKGMYLSLDMGDWIMLLSSRSILVFISKFQQFFPPCNLYVIELLLALVFISVTTTLLRHAIVSDLEIFGRRLIILYNLILGCEVMMSVQWYCLLHKLLDVVPTVKILNLAFSAHPWPMTFVNYQVCSQLRFLHNEIPVYWWHWNLNLMVLMAYC